MSPIGRTTRVSLLRRALRWGVRGIGLAAALSLSILGYFWFTTPLPAPEHLRARAALGSTRILDRHGQLLYELPDPLSGRQRPVALSQLPAALRQATVIGCTIASFTVERFSLDRLRDLELAEVRRRFDAFRHLVHFDALPDDLG